MSFEALRYLRPCTGLDHGPQPRICVNYLGRFDGTGDQDGLLRGTAEPLGQDLASTTERSHLLDIIAAVENGRLRLEWEYSGEVHDESTVRALADRTVHALREITAHCATHSGRTPSDFPLATLTQSEVDGLASRDVEDVYPLTPMQAGMLFHSLADSVDDPAGAYVTHTRVRLTGVDDPRAFAAAWQRVVDRTPTLRSAFVWRGVGDPVQVVHRDVQVPVTYGPGTEEPLDPAVAPLMRLAADQVEPGTVDLLWTCHHLLLDGWSTSQVFADVLTEYTAPGTAQARRPFRDYLAWLADRDVAAAEQHWRDALDGITERTPLPFDRP